MVTAKRVVSMLGAGLCVYFSVGQTASAQEPLKVNPHIHVAVDLVQLNVAVTDSKGNYITGLKPGDFTVLRTELHRRWPPLAKGTSRRGNLQIAQTAKRRTPETTWRASAKGKATGS